MLVVLVAVVAVQIKVHRRWMTFRVLRSFHEAAAAEFAWLASASAATADRCARSAERAETRAIAEGERHREREARDKERSYRETVAEETRRADEYRRRW
jgi:hypothetical protein